MAATEAAREIKKSEDISSLGVGKATPIQNTLAKTIHMVARVTPK